jgi:cupin 2 domain-containing protein
MPPEKPADGRFFFAVNQANLFHRLPRPATGEAFEELLRRRNLVIERIASSGHPEPVLYDQVQDEWVLLLQGEATLELAGEALELGPGDHLFIPAHTPHRVLRTSQQPRCLWLAVHLYPDATPD